MKKQLYAIHDQCSGLYETPHFSATDELVMREFQDLANNIETPIGRHPEHYTLVRLAIFDNTTGNVVNEENESLCTALEAISPKQQAD